MPGLPGRAKGDIMQMRQDASGSAFFVGLTGDIRENEAVMAKAYKLGKKLAAGG